MKHIRRVVILLETGVKYCILLLKGAGDSMNETLESHLSISSGLG
jgi:hypothetical protein